MLQPLIVWGRVSRVRVLCWLSVIRADKSSVRCFGTEFEKSLFERSLVKRGYSNSTVRQSLAWRSSSRALSSWLYDEFVDKCDSPCFTGDISPEHLLVELPP